ncbi:MAG: ATP-binding cassette domain-containing protein, partial [candidate division NC10 bacterium]
MILEVEKINTYYGTSHILFGVSISVAAGEAVCLLGRNGAGKTTTMRSIIGLTPPRSGSIRFLGKETRGMRAYAVSRLGIGYAPDDRRVFPDLTVRQNLTFFGGVYGLSDAEIAGRETWAIGMAGLEGKEEAATGSLPGGWKQRLALACSVLHRPRLLFLDEPTGGVDPISRR